MKIILDVFGCDNPPTEILSGVKLAMDADIKLEPVLCGDVSIMQPILEGLGADFTRIELIDAKEVISNDEVPTTAIRRKRDSSLVRAIECIKEREDIAAMISAGSTGAVLCVAALFLGMIDGVVRPALAPIIPTLSGGNVCLIDSGANVDCHPEFLVQFAMLGASYMRAVYKMPDPKIALMSVGTEDKKGNELTKEVFKRLSELSKNDMSVNFVGNMEARDALSGKYDVLVCDGFVGNVFLKTLEGTLKFTLSKLKSAIKSSKKASFGALFMKGAFNKLKDELDYNAKGGAPLLGVEKIVVKCHGSSDRNTIKGAFNQAVLMAQGRLIENTKEELQKLNKGAKKSEE